MHNNEELLVLSEVEINKDSNSYDSQCDCDDGGCSGECPAD